MKTKEQNQLLIIRTVIITLGVVLLIAILNHLLF